MFSYGFLWKFTIFNGEIYCKWPFSTAIDTVYGGFHSHGGTILTAIVDGWFISWKMPYVYYVYVYAYDDIYIYI